MTKKKLLYNNYLHDMMSIYNAEIDKIKVVHSFEYGDEFEVALCKILRLVLPKQFGVCRGFAIDAEGNEAGDDIIIYDQHHYPTLGLRDKDDGYSRKEFIAIESIYGYIEAKHTIHLTGSIDDGQSLAKSVSQVRAVKTLCAKRSRVELGETRHIRPSIPFSSLPNYPNYSNPPWGAIFARNIRKRKNGKIISTSEEIRNAGGLEVVGTNCPDVCALGQNIVNIPVVPNKEGGKHSLCYFSIEDKTEFWMRGANNCGPAVGIAALLGALDWLILGKFQWEALIIDAVEPS